MKLNVRKAVMDDLDRLMEIFAAAKRFMADTGNPGQWVAGYPQRELMAGEIASSWCYVCETEEGRVVATFCLIPGPTSLIPILKTEPGLMTGLIM